MVLHLQDRDKTTIYPVVNSVCPYLQIFAAKTTYIPMVTISLSSAR